MPKHVVAISAFVFCIVVLAICEAWVELTGKRYFITIGQWIGVVVMLSTLLYLVLTG